MKNRRIKFIAILLVAMGLMAVPVYAEKIYFTITIPGDTYSRKASKADEEQLFYVTGAYFEYNYASLNCYSRQEDDSSVVSQEVEISPNAPSNRGAYKKWANSGEYYRMHAYCFNATNFNVQGYYNP